MIVFDPIKMIVTIVAGLMTAGLFAGFVRHWKEMSNEKRIATVKLWVLVIGIAILAVVYKNEKWPEIAWSWISRIASCGILLYIGAFALRSRKSKKN